MPAARPGLGSPPRRASPRLGRAFAAGLADQRGALADQGEVAAGGADVGAAAEAGAFAGDRQEDEVVRRRAVREALGDGPRGLAIDST